MPHHLIAAPQCPLRANATSPCSLFLPHSSDPSRCASFGTNWYNIQKSSVLNCRSVEIPTLTHCLNEVDWKGSVKSEGRNRVGVKEIDVTTLGNLCIDIVLNVNRLPPAPKAERKAYMEQLAASPPDKKFWEAGGNCNTAIAAVRLGLSCTALGHVGNDIYGKFLLDVLRDEGISMVEMSTETDHLDHATTAAFETLLCWVLVDPLQRHGFCSRADFSDEPAFSWMNDLTAAVKMTIQRSKILVVNGYGFDELSPGLILSALKYAVEVGTSIFFDPGPRGRSLSAGTQEEQEALSVLLKMSDVLLLTSDEAESLTGVGNPILAGQQLLKQRVRTKWVIVKMGSKGSILITSSSISCAPAFKVDVLDSVGCGDSFVAAIAYGFVHKMPTVHTLAIANAVGAATAMGCGAGRNVAALDQVMDIIKSGDLNEDDKFWNEILDGNPEVQKTTLLSKMALNGHNIHLSRLCYDVVVPELRSKLESAGVGAVQT